MIRRPPRSTQSRSSAASDVYKRQPVYAFDRIVVPVGSEIIGKVTKIETLSGGKRTQAALNADFTPRRKVEIGFDELVLGDGRRFPLHTSVTPGSGQVIELAVSYTHL